MIQTVKLSYHTRKEQEKKSSMFDGFLKSSKQMDVESERVIMSRSPTTWIIALRNAVAAMTQLVFTETQDFSG